MYANWWQTLLLHDAGQYESHRTVAHRCGRRNDRGAVVRLDLEWDETVACGWSAERYAWPFRRAMWENLCTFRLSCEGHWRTLFHSVTMRLESYRCVFATAVDNANYRLAAKGQRMFRTYYVLQWDGPAVLEWFTATESSIGEAFAEQLFGSYVGIGVGNIGAVSVCFVRLNSVIRISSNLIFSSQHNNMSSQMT